MTATTYNRRYPGRASDAVLTRDREQRIPS